MSDTRLTADFWLSEFTGSGTALRLGIANTPPPNVLATITGVLAPGLQQVRGLLGAPIVIKSGYRSAQLNAAVRGASSSQHLTGHAADFVAPGFGTPLQVCQCLLQHQAALRWDQLIYEGTWVHISFAPRPRNQVLTAHFAAGRVRYTQGLA